MSIAEVGIDQPAPGITMTGNKSTDDMNVQTILCETEERPKF
jgi:hypothetical protein